MATTLRSIYGEVLRTFFEGKLTRRNERRVTTLAREFYDLGASPTDIRVRFAWYKQTWPKAAATPEALVKHWSSMKPPPEKCQFSRHIMDEQRHVGNGEGPNMTHEELWLHRLRRLHRPPEYRRVIRDTIDYLRAYGVRVPPWLKIDDGQLELWK